MNDDIDKINSRNRELNEQKSPGDQSRAKYSNITHPDEDRKKIAEGRDNIFIPRIDFLFL